MAFFFSVFMDTFFLIGLLLLAILSTFSYSVDAAAAAAAITNKSSITGLSCGTSGGAAAVVITIDAVKKSGVSLTKHWANDVQRIYCRNRRFNITSSDNNHVAAQRVCGSVGSSSSFVDIAFLSRPLQPNEATTSNDNDGYRYNCTKQQQQPTTTIGGVRGGTKKVILSSSRTVFQVPIAMDAVVLVTAPNGTAAYCIHQLQQNNNNNNNNNNDGLTLEQLRILFSNYSLAQILNITTAAPSTLSPTSSVPPTSSRVPSTAPFPIASAVPISVTSVPTSRPSSLAAPVTPLATPIASPTIPTIPPGEQPVSAPIPLRPTTSRPTLTLPTLRTVHWGFPHGTRVGAGMFNIQHAGVSCNDIPALIAGPPSASDAYQTFAQKVLPEYDSGSESISPSYYSGRSTKQIVNYLQSNTNAVAFLSWSDYMFYQSKLEAVNLQVVNGTAYVAPNVTTLMSGMYPLSNSMYMEVRSDHRATLDCVRPFVEFAFSVQGHDDVVQAGLVPIQPNAVVQAQVQMLVQLGGMMTKTTKAPVKRMPTRSMT